MIPHIEFLDKEQCKKMSLDMPPSLDETAAERYNMNHLRTAVGLSYEKAVTEMLIEKATKQMEMKETAKGMRALFSSISTVIPELGKNIPELAKRCLTADGRVVIVYPDGTEKPESDEVDYETEITKVERTPQELQDIEENNQQLQSTIEFVLDETKDESIIQSPIANTNFVSPKKKGKTGTIHINPNQQSLF